MAKTSGGIRSGSAQVLSLDEYLGRRGLASPISDFMDDKLRGMQRVIGTAKGQARFRREANAARTTYSDRRDAAIAEYKSLVSQGKIVAPTKVQRLLKTARGNSDNPSVQAARKLLKKKYNITSW